MSDHDLLYILMGVVLWILLRPMILRLIGGM